MKRPEGKACIRGAECKGSPPLAFREGKGTCRACENADRRERRAEERPFDPDTLKGCLPWASSLEREAIEAFIRYGSVTETAEALGMTVRLLRGHLIDLQRRAARQGYSPEHDMQAPVPDGFSVKGVSTYYKVQPDGTMVPRGQWVKTRAEDQTRFEALAEAMRGLTEQLDIRGALEAASAPQMLDEDLLAIYPMGDPHFGMHSWAEETGQNFDLKTAESNLVAAVASLVALAPPAKEALIINLGDFFHADNLAGVTARSGHHLDMDTRLPKVHRVGLRAMRACIDHALRKHERVTVWCVIGNHDDLTSTMLALCLQALYENEPRVIVETSPAKFFWYRFGGCLIGATHGDTVKMQQLGGVMATDRARDWGETEHRYWYTGHLHQDRAIELPGVLVETFRTLAPADAWAKAAGYRSGQDMKCDVLHRRYGRMNRHVVGIRQIWDRSAAGL